MGDIQLPVVQLQDLLELHQGNHMNLKLINIRGCNGSGKSTIPMSMMESDSDSFEVVWNTEGKSRTVATVFPNYNIIALGHYHSKCGGLDSVKDTDTTKALTRILWNLNYDILMEGIMASTVRQTYIDLFIDLNNTQEYKRNVIIYNILPPLEVCLKRIQERNGGKPIKEEQVESKWKTVERNAQYFEDAGFTSLRVSNDGISREETLDWFFKNLGVDREALEPKAITKPKEEVECHLSQNTQTEKDESDVKKVSKDAKIKELVKDLGKPEEMYLPTTSDLKGYDWAEYYKEPNESVVINWNNMRLYWYWIAERMNIWYKRTVLKQPQPWTDDEILQTYKFTNCIRDLDKGTIVYIREILSKMDEPCEDIVKRTKEVILNTQIYRLFLKKETWDEIGFIYLDTWEEQWSAACSKLRQMKKDSKTIWHSAYFVNDLKSANPNKTTNSDKVENAICLCNYFHDDIDDTYNYITTHNMKDCLEYLTHWPAISYFTVYEWLSDFGMAYKHVNNTIVDWTDDSYVNIGPGNKRGLDYIFVDKGNLSYYECNFYLRASWKSYMKRYGYYDRFMEQLPDFMCEDINMRVIEHDLCELSKYLGVYYGVGSVKGKFQNTSKDNLDSLIL